MPHTLLILDDEINILNSLKRTLRREPYQLITAERCDEALSLIEITPPTVILSDYLMPEMNGLQFLLEAKKKVPDVVSLIFSGYADMDALIKAIREGGVYNFIPKPWEDVFLKIEIKRAIEQYDLTQKNKVLNNRLEEEFSAAVELLSFLPRAKEPSLRPDADRLKETAIKLGKRTGLDMAALKDLEIAARLHDFGTLAVSSIILNKPDRLTPSERKEVEKHVLFPEERLKGMRRFDEICKIIRHHHEFYNGEGYPDHLQGDAIPLPSRILSIAEVYDALLSDRPFRKAFTQTEALTLMKDNRGKQFDPALIDFLLEEASKA